MSTQIYDDRDLGDASGHSLKLRQNLTVVGAAAITGNLTVNGAVKATGVPVSVTYTIGALTSHVIKVTGQLKDAAGNVLTSIANCRMYVSDASTGLGRTATPLTTEAAISTYGTLSVDVTEVAWTVSTDNTGKFAINITQSAAQAYYFVVILPNGTLAVSTVLTFT